MATKKKAKKPEEPTAPKQDEKFFCCICEKMGRGEVPSAVKESDGRHYCYEHHMDYNSCMKESDMLAGKKRLGMF